MVLYPIAQVKGYMKEEGLDERVIFVAPTTSIQAMLGGDVQFTGAGSSALVSMARGNTPLKVIVATNDRVLQWFVTRPEITNPKELKGKKIAPPASPPSQPLWRNRCSPNMGSTATKM